MLRVPSGVITKLEAYLENLENEKKISLKDIARVSNQQICTSLNQYSEGKGWKNITEAQWSKIHSTLKSSRSKRSLKERNFLITPLFQSWNYKHHSLASELISLYCRSPTSFAYDDLPFKCSRQNTNDFKYSQTEIGLLKLMLKRGVLKINLVPDQLVLEFSLDNYWISIPKIPSIDQLSNFLEILPYCRVIYADSKLHLLTLLTPKLVEWIKRDLDWDIILVNPFYYPQKLDRDWYNFETHHWIVPEDIEGF